MAGHDEASYRRGIKRAITILHEKAERMNDPQAQRILNSAAFTVGLELRKIREEARARAAGIKVMEAE